MKKGQSEGIGLVMIVAFLIFAMLFALVFMVTQSETTIESDYKMNAISSNFLATVFRTTTDCSGYSLTELVIDCSLEYPNSTSLKHFFLISGFNSGIFCLLIFSLCVNSLSGRGANLCLKLKKWFSLPVTSEFVR